MTAWMADQASIRSHCDLGQGGTVGRLSKLRMEPWPVCFWYDGLVSKIEKICKLTMGVEEMPLAIPIDSDIGIEPYDLSAPGSRQPRRSIRPP